MKNKTEVVVTLEVEFSSLFSMQSLVRLTRKDNGCELACIDVGRYLAVPSVDEIVAFATKRFFDSCSDYRDVYFCTFEGKRVGLKPVKLVYEYRPEGTYIDLFDIESGEQLPLVPSASMLKNGPYLHAFGRTPVESLKSFYNTESCFRLDDRGYEVTVLEEKKKPALKSIKLVYKYEGDLTWVRFFDIETGEPITAIVGHGNYGIHANKRCTPAELLKFYNEDAVAFSAPRHGYFVSLAEQEQKLCICHYWSEDDGTHVKFFDCADKKDITSLFSKYGHCDSSPEPSTEEIASTYHLVLRDHNYKIDSFVLLPSRKTNTAKIKLELLELELKQTKKHLDAELVLSRKLRQKNEDDAKTIRALHDDVAALTTLKDAANKAYHELKAVPCTPSTEFTKRAEAFCDWARDKKILWTNGSFFVSVPERFDQMEKELEADKLTVRELTKALQQATLDLQIIKQKVKAVGD